MQVFTKEELSELSTNVFMAMGANELDAIQASDVLTSADARGIDSHGVSRLVGYVALWEGGRINMTPEVKIIREHKSTFSIDGDGGLGLVVAPKAMAIAVERAKQYGSGWGAIQNSNHFGIAGYHAMMALPHDMIGMAMTNATPFIPPTHSKEAMLGTNPIAYAFPAGVENPLVIDLATASVARGKIEIARREGKVIPKGWMVDKHGNTSQNVDELKDGGMLTPLGSLEELSSHKGYALGGLVDVMTGVLSGANYGKWVPPFVSFLPMLPNLPGKGLGHFVGAMEIEGFRDTAEFKSSMDHWIQSFKSAERVEADQEVYVPGEKEYRIEAERTANGIPLNDKVVEDLEGLKKKFRV
jgi:LDH2 family malate/lactate/ureidoglycolate dehydrogenase|tara:strand:- start:14795 stop:15862 length:1068 start_codon:yes stop_codon:yes gene_type:complete